jgi:hypothetical protein
MDAIQGELFRSFNISKYNSTAFNLSTPLRLVDNDSRYRVKGLGLIDICLGNNVAEFY